MGFMSHSAELAEERGRDVRTAASIGPRNTGLERHGSKRPPAGYGLAHRSPYGTDARAPDVSEANADPAFRGAGATLRHMCTASLLTERFRHLQTHGIAS